MTENINTEQLALYGGMPTRKVPWPAYTKGHVFIDDQDAEMLQDVIKSKRLFRYDDRPLSETKTGQFEHALTQYFNVKYALAVSSGTAALALSLMALDLPKGAVIGCPTYTFTATPSAILLAGMEPLLINVDEDLHIDLNDLENKIAKMQAMIVVHMRGFAAPITDIIAICQKYSIPVIEDAVPVLGAQLMGKHLGTFGVAGAFSTQSDKSLNTGEGGFLLTDDEALYLKAVILSGAYEDNYQKHCPEQVLSPSHLALPIYNFRLDEIRGALSLSQLNKLDHRLQRLDANYRYLASHLSALNKVSLRAPHYSEQLPIGDNVLLKIHGSAEDAIWFAHALCAEGIDARAMGEKERRNARRFWNWEYLYHDTLLTAQESLVQSQDYISRYIDIPLSPTLTQQDIDECIAAILKVHEYYESNENLG
ncbi:DegT/DnrJ/EryC1/StrS aminotransferase family protein [uncultured Shewanella sp.]|uniref:DegT/DnrJ/EryC1/StrS family aminotransferase n=1 Tax=uncultured Shewanella sp. TaxID=173975 RepID=UPI002616645E|nr:DegT/DnrJ/EryC1/StrS aminotransferase family protein [uncultured Shewanella sp.]